MANTILVTYDLRGDEQSSDYTQLIREIKAYGEALHPLYSVWLLRTDWTAEQVFKDLRPHVDDDDRLLVWDVTARSAWWRNLSSTDSAWIKATP